jgi:selT/selW/selH-like putative selenoprotein
LAAAIKKEVDVDSELVRGGGGIFDVTVNNKKIFSKHDSARFPTEAEIIEKIRSMQ